MPMRAVWIGLVWCAPALGLAADAGRGAQLYLQGPADVPLCVSCHGADPAVSRNNLLRAADQPTGLLKTLGTVSAMGYLRPLLSETDIADLAAYLGQVARAQAAPLAEAWPRTLEFGSLQPGAVSPTSEVLWQNRSSQPVAAPQPRLAGGRFQLAHNCNGLVPAGGDCRVKLYALGGPIGDSADALWLAADPPVVIGVSVRVRDEPVAVWQYDAPADGVDFGPVTLGQRAEHQIVVHNRGSMPGLLGVGTLTGPGAAAFTGFSGCDDAQPVQPGRSCVLTLRYQPGAALEQRAALQWRGDGTHPPVLALRGSGAATPPVAEPGPQPGAGGSGGGGGCAAAPAARPGDVTLWALGLAAVAALAGRRRRPMTGR